jgi:hypothetical protein
MGQSAQLIATVLLMAYIHNAEWPHTLTRQVIQYSVSIQPFILLERSVRRGNFLLEG